MDKSAMLLGGPGLDGYAFRADCYCVKCGHGIIKALPCGHYTELEARDMETVPQPIFFGQSGEAQYCGICGEYMYGGGEYQ